MRDGRPPSLRITFFSDLRRFTTHLCLEHGGTTLGLAPEVIFQAIGQALLWSALPNGRRATFYNVWAGHSLRPARFRRHLEADLGQVFRLLAEGAITANIAARFPLEEAGAALALAESRTLNGKVILLP